MSNEDLELRAKQANQIADQAREVTHAISSCKNYSHAFLFLTSLLQGEKRTRYQMEEKVSEELRLKREIEQMRKDIEQLQVSCMFPSISDI